MNSPKSIPGVSDHPKYEGVTCYGLKLQICEQPYCANQTHLFELAKPMYSTTMSELNGEYFKPFFTKLAGGPELQKQIEAGFLMKTFTKVGSPAWTQFNNTRAVNTYCISQKYSHQHLRSLTT